MAWLYILDKANWVIPCHFHILYVGIWISVCPFCGGSACIRMCIHQGPRVTARQIRGNEKDEQNIVCRKQNGQRRWIITAFIVVISCKTAANLYWEVRAVLALLIPFRDNTPITTFHGAFHCCYMDGDISRPLGGSGQTGIVGFGDISKLSRLVVFG